MPTVTNVGTLLNTPPVALINTMNSITAKLPADEIADNILRPSPTLWAMIKKGKHVQASELVYPILSIEETTNGAYWGAQLLDTSLTDSVQPANQVWCPYQQTVVIPRTDIIFNSGPDGVLDIVEEKLKIALGSMLMMLARASWGISPRNTSIDVDNIPAWVQQSTNTIAGINRSTNSFWQPKTAAVAGGASTITETDMEKEYLNQTYGYDEPDAIVMSHNVYHTFKVAFTQNVRFIKPELDSDTIIAGFKEHFVYNNAVVMPERFLQDFTVNQATATPSNTVFLLNTKYIYPVFHARDYFVVQPWQKPSNQEVLVSRITITWNIKCNNPRMQGTLTGYGDGN